MIAAGGLGLTGVLLENDGSGWTEVTPDPDLPALRGIAVIDGAACAVGQYGVLLLRDGDGWRGIPTQTTTEDLHAAWIDPIGGVWAAGGQFDAVPMADGTLIHGGDELAAALDSPPRL